MTKPKYFFQGFKGARKVQSMMIDFPELRFLYETQRGLKLVCELLTSRNIAFQYFGGQPLPSKGYMFEITYFERTSDDYSQGFNSEEGDLKYDLIFFEDKKQKIFVAPESEVFFENVDADYDGSTGKTIYMPQEES